MLQYYLDDTEEVNKLYESLSDGEGKLYELTLLFKQCKFQTLLHEYEIVLKKNISVKHKLEIESCNDASNESCNDASNESCNDASNESCNDASNESCNDGLRESPNDKARHSRTGYFKKVLRVTDDILESLLQEMHIHPLSCDVDVYKTYCSVEEFKDDSILYADWILRHALYIRTIKHVYELSATEFEEHEKLEKILFDKFKLLSTGIVSRFYIESKSATAVPWIDEIKFWNSSFVDLHLSENACREFLSREIRYIFDYISSNEVTCPLFKDSISKVLMFIRSIINIDDRKTMEIFVKGASQVVRENRWMLQISEKIGNVTSIPNQNFCVIALRPSKYAIPDDSGIYGKFCVYGSFSSLELAEEYCKNNINNSSTSVLRIIRNRHAVPFTTERKYTDDGGVVQLTKPCNDEKCVVENPAAKEDLSMEKRAHIVKSGDMITSPIEKYIKERQSMGSCSYFVEMYEQKIKELKTQYEASYNRAKRLEASHPSVKQEYMDHYKRVTSETGLDKCDDEMALYIKKHIGNEI